MHGFARTRHSLQALDNRVLPESARMKRLWEKGLFRSKTAMGDLDCLSHIQRLAADTPDDPPTKAPVAE